MNLGIPCTENRQSKRRGPPNRTLQRIKAQQAGEISFDGTGSSSPDSAAQALTTLANQTAAGVVVLGELQVVTALLDDYFTYVHPVAPIPHEPTFRAALSARADLHDPSFVALGAAMVGAFTAACPRRARMHFSQANGNVQSFSASDYAAHCRSIVLRAMPPEYLEKRPFSIYDTMINYLLGLASMYEGNYPNSQLYFNQCQAILSSRNLQASGDSIDEELRRRTFWALFSSVKDLEQLGHAPQALAASVGALGQTIGMPLLNDDEYLTASGPIPVPQGFISRHMVFDNTIRLYETYTQLSALEELTSLSIISWPIIQKQYENSMADVDLIFLQVSPAISINPQSDADNAPHNSNHQYPPGQYPLPRDSDAYRDRAIREALLQEISTMPKAILCANVLQIKSYLVEKYICALQFHTARSDALGDLKFSSENKSHQQTAYEAQFEAALRNKDELTRHVLNALIDISHREDTRSLLLEFVVKLRYTIVRLLHTPSPSRDGDRSTGNETTNGTTTTPKGPVVLRASPYLDAVANVLGGLEHYLSVRGDRDGVETEVQQCWTEIKALGNEFGVEQMLKGLEKNTSS